MFSRLACKEERIMGITQQADDEQAKLWNGPAGWAWVESQALLDQMFKPFEDLLVNEIAGKTRGKVLDVGCGTGSTTIALAQRLGTHGGAVGIDVSEPMIAAARERAAQTQTPASFIRADAQSHAFEAAAFDAIMSRFGVMFFADPMQAFANLRRATKEGGELRFVAWRHADLNPFMTTAERAAAPLLPNLPARRPVGPGQFAFADSQRVCSILEASGWSDIDVRPIDVACTLPEKELVPYLTRLGPVGLILRQVDDQTREQVIDAVRTAFEPYVQGADVCFTAACWLVGARALSTTQKPSTASNS
jgi:SAM-dependent methyltransferase